MYFNSKRGQLVFDLQKESTAERHEKILNELTVKFDRLDALFDELLAEHQITLEEFADFLSNPNHFEKEAWEALEKAGKMLDQKLSLEIDHVKNPQTTLDKYRDIQRSRQWLYVR